MAEISSFGFNIGSGVSTQLDTIPGSDGVGHSSPTIITEGLGEKFDLGLCDYGRSPAWQMGSFFFKQTARDIFKENVSRIKPGLNRQGKIIQDENVMLEMTDENFKGINNRIKRMNITYDFGMRRVKLCYERAIKPLKVLHFHPNSKLLNTLAIAMYGKNEIGKPLMNERLINLFKSYGYN